MSIWPLPSPVRPGVVAGTGGPGGGAFSRGCELPSLSLSGAAALSSAAGGGQADRCNRNRSLQVGCPPGTPGPWASFAASPSPERRAKSVSKARKPWCLPIL